MQIVMLAAVFFVVGFSWRDVRASGWSPAGVKTALLAIPDRMQMLMEQPQPVEDKLRVRETYQEVMSTIIDRFYPPASSVSTTVVKTPTNSLSGEKVTQQPSLDRKQLTYMAVRGVLASLDDPFTGFLDPTDYKKMREENDGNFVGIGAQLWTNKQGQVYVKEPLPDCPAIKAGIKKGDIILKVDGQSVGGKDIDEVVKMIRGPEGTRVTLAIARGKELKPLSFTIRRQVVEYRMVEHEMIDKQDGIGWLLLRQFNSKADEQMDQALTDLENHKMRALILDLRDNPGGLLESAVEIGSRFIPKGGPVVIIKERGGQTSKLEVDPTRQDHKQYPLVVLVNEMSASASEIVAGAIKDTHSGTLIGSTTFGKGRVQTIVPLPGDSAVRITTAKYLTPSGHDINKDRITKKGGIHPDIEVKALEDPPEDADEADRLKYDPQMQKAVAVLKQKLASVSSGKVQAMR